MRLQTKAQREAAQQAQIDNLINKYQYQLENYKELKILTRSGELRGNEYHHIKVFKASAAHEIVNSAYPTKDQLLKAIENVKNSYNRTIEWKAEQKEKNKGHQSTHAACAAAIKEELKKVFPNVKFSVKSDSYSGGDSVHIGYTDGPTRDQVENITDKYQYGRFDGMSDMYESTNSRDDIPQSKYVSAHRSISDEVINMLLPQMEEFLKGYEKHSYRDEPSEILNRLLNKTALIGTVKGLERTATQSGFIEDFYRVVMEAPEAPEPTKDETRPEAVEVPAGEVQIIEYSDKAIAVIGETKPIKELLKSLGGRFNFRLTCGAGWVFPKGKLNEVAAAIQSHNTPQAQIEAPKEEIQEAEPQTAQEIADAKTTELLTGIQEIIEKREEAKAELKKEIQQTLDFFKDTDIAIYGEITEGTKEAERVQNTYKAPEVREFDNLEDMEQAAKNGEVISLTNMFELCQKKNKK